VPASTPLGSVTAPMKSSNIWQSAWFCGLGGWPETSEM
jgi:hypothetical protein